jgi:quinoprotein glucose dehydrogenase
VIKDRYVGRLQGLQGPDGLPLFKPPFGRLTAIDLTRGEHVWVVPVGEGPRHHALLEPLQLGRLGWNRRSFPLATRTLLFVAQMGPASGAQPASDGPGLEVFDKTSGDLIAKVELPANATGALMTYFAGGKQYVVVPIGGRGRPAELVALSLP